ncbi:hypothetical protein HDU99_000122, partial [Rhizoclosmatium hyalinum]
MKTFARLSSINKLVRSYCWSPPVSRATYLIERHGKRHAISKALTESWLAGPQSADLLSCMVSMGATHSCDKTEEPSSYDCALMKLVEMPDAKTLVPLYYAARPKLKVEHMRDCLYQVGSSGDVPLLLIMLNLSHNACPEE